MRATTKIAVVMAMGCGVANADTESWPRFRGADGRGVAPAQNVPAELNQDTQAWSVPLPGPGSSSPVVWDGLIFVTSEVRKTGEVALVCLDAVNGKVRWHKIVKTGSYATHQMNNAAAATPCVSEEVVAFTWYDSARGVAVLSAHAHGGDELWRFDIGPFKGQHGLNLQPEIHDGRVLIAHLHQEDGYVTALDAKSGKPIWKKTYPGANPKTTYITPLVRARHTQDGPGKEVVVASTNIGVRGLDFETGEETWSVEGQFRERCIVSPVDILTGSGAKDSLLTVGCKNNVFFAVRPPDAGRGTAEIAWRLDRNAPYVPTPVSDGNTLYVLADGGVLQALDPLTGKSRWQEKLPGNFYASPLLIGGKLYCQSREGELFVAEVGEAFELLATSDLRPGDEVEWCDATPAVAHDSLYVRVGARLDCYRTRQ